MTWRREELVDAETRNEVLSQLSSTTCILDPVLMSLLKRIQLTFFK